MADYRESSRLHITCPRLAAAVLLSVAFGAGQGQIQIGPVETDPGALSKLARGDLDRVDTSDRGLRDLTAIFQGLIDTECKYEARKGDPPVRMDIILERIQKSGNMIGPLIKVHPAYGNTLIYVSTYKCGSDQVYRLQKSLFAAFTLPPPPELKLIEPALQAQEIKRWWEYSWGEPNPGGKFEATLGDAKVLLCHYHSPSNYSPITRIAWFDGPPASSKELQRLKASHPIWEIGNLRMEKCPKRIGEFDAAKKQAG